MQVSTTTFPRRNRKKINIYNEIGIEKSTVETSYEHGDYVIDVRHIINTYIVCDMVISSSK